MKAPRQFTDFIVALDGEHGFVLAAHQLANGAGHLPQGSGQYACRQDRENFILDEMTLPEIETKSLITSGIASAAKVTPATTSDGI